MRHSFCQSIFPIKTHRLLVRSSACLLACAAITLAGCGEAADPGPPRAEVRGSVSYQGKPVEGGTIDFIPTGDTVGPTASAKIQNGKYEIPLEQGATVGRNRVEIRGIRKTGKQIEAGSPSPHGTMVDEVESFIPPQYNSSTELAVDIKAGVNENMNFDLK